MAQTVLAPRLVVLDPRGAVLGEFPLDRDSLTLGRSPGCDVAVPDPHVSRRHAEVVRRADGWLLCDLGSANGTFLGGVRVATPALLRDGDLIGLGTVRIRFEDPRSRAGGPVRPAPGLPAPRAPAGVAGPGPTVPVGLTIDRQSAEVISNVEGTQINYIQRQRESFTRQVFAAKTRARRMIWLGIALVVAGLVAVGSAVLPFMETVFGSVSSQTMPDAGQIDVFAHRLAGIPVITLGFGADLLGGLLVVLGIVLHVVAAARGRQVEDRFPYPGQDGRRLQH